MNPYYKDYPDKQLDYLKKIINILVVSSKLVERDDNGKPITYVTTDGVGIPPVGFTSTYGISIYHRFLWELKDHLERIYGLTDEESDYVWNKYRSEMVVFDNRRNGYDLIPSLINV